MANGYPMMNYGRPYPKTPEQLQNEMQASIDQAGVYHSDQWCRRHSQLHLHERS